MKTILHYQASDLTKTWSLHLWSGAKVWDLKGKADGSTVDFEFPEDAGDLRKAQFKFRAEDDKGTYWEDEALVRHVRMPNPAEIWCFAFSPRLLYREPTPPGVSFHVGDTLTVHVVTKSRFKGGEIYAWDGYDPKQASVRFPETSRSEGDTGLSTFVVAVSEWMTRGFHFKLVREDSTGADWEPDSANRVWRPCDGASLWIKSGQPNVRRKQLALTPIPVEMLYPATMELPPRLNVTDLGEARTDPVDASSHDKYTQNPLFRVAKYQVGIYPDAPYVAFAEKGTEGGDTTILRELPPDPTQITATARFVLGFAGWLTAFPTVAKSTTLNIQPDLAESSFRNGLRVSTSIGRSQAYETVDAVRQSDGTWNATLDVLQNIRTYVRLVPAIGEEPKPYDWIDTDRHFTPPDKQATFYATERIFGLTSRGKTNFAEPPSRRELMQAAFGAAVVGSGIFDIHEMPHGATIMGNDVYFVLHAPHAVSSALVLVEESDGKTFGRRTIPMTVTPDVRYWWCTVPKMTAPAGTRYRFALNDDDEVMDPAAREVQDGGNFDTSSQDDPNDPQKSWSVVFDAGAAYERAHRRPWQTVGWESLLIYELHAKRFAQLNANSMFPLELLADELKPVSRLGKPGYLWQLPVTALELLPVHEFKSNNSWGYNPSFYFAVDSSYGGGMAMAEFVDAAHESGKAVILDVVYNHSQDSPLVKIARDVYRNGDAWGDRMNCGHPMVLEFLRQATIYLWRTFNLCGFRFDDTKTIVRDCDGGWNFLSQIRSGLEAAANAEGRRWPYCVAENDQEGRAFDIPHPSWGVLDGEWAWDEVYRIRDVSYDTWDTRDDADRLKEEMEKPRFENRPFYIAVRQAENHDRVSGQDCADQRIASRPPWGQGLRLAKALGTIPLLSNGVPLLFMGEEYGETRAFSFDNYGQSLDPEQPDLPDPNTRVAAWFSCLMELRNDSAKGLRGESNYQVVKSARRTCAFTCGADQRLFAIVTWGTPDQRQDTSWLGLPAGSSYKEIFNSSWPAFQVEQEQEQANGGYAAQIYSGDVLNLPYIGAVLLERR